MTYLIASWALAPVASFLLALWAREKEQEWQRAQVTVGLVAAHRAVSRLITAGWPLPSREASERDWDAIEGAARNADEFVRQQERAFLIGRAPDLIEKARRVQTLTFDE